MPTYTFMNAEAGIEYDVTMLISEYDDYMDSKNEQEANTPSSKSSSTGVDTN